MPRVVPDQRSKFENEEFFRKLSRECEIKYTGFRDRPHEERQARFQNACRDGRSEIDSKCETRCRGPVLAGRRFPWGSPRWRMSANGAPRVELEPEPDQTSEGHCLGGDTEEGFRVFVASKPPFGKRTGASFKAFVATGTNLSLQFFPASWQGEQRQTPSREYVDLEREAGKVYLKAPMILNGVCVIWKGWIDLQRLDGMGCLEFDEERAQQEDALAQQAFEEARRRTREFEDRDRSHREEMEVRVSQLLAVTGKKTARP
ncbi:core-binding factor subunit beta isoform X2 [Symphalangus syndactylus]|uniref:core-binding factor subunit beta isoform X2 n=1 Tax=Symphalangus syndactylus TaxID=9590 RepID=UPI003004F038